MSSYFVAGVGGILVSGVFATLLMLANVEASPGLDDPCSFSSGYGIGGKTCSDPTGRMAFPPATAPSDTGYKLSTDLADHS